VLEAPPGRHFCGVLDASGPARLITGVSHDSRACHLRTAGLVRRLLFQWIQLAIKGSVNEIV
jgi:hypothetical protein